MSRHVRRPRAILALALAVVALAPHAGAIDYRSSTTATVGSGATVAYAKPAGAVAGDLLLAQVTAEGGSSLGITPPVGWTLVLRTSSGTSGLTQAIYRKVTTATEPTTYAWTLSQSNGGVAGGILAFTSVDEASPVDVFGGSSKSNSRQVTAPSVTTTTTDALLVGFYGSNRETGFTPPNGMTERFDVTPVGAGGPAASAATVVQEVAGASGTKTANAGTSGRVVGQLVALKPRFAQFAAAQSTALETAGSAQLSVTLSVASARSVSIAYAVTGGSAKSGQDFTLPAGTITFQPGETQRSIPVTILADSLAEGDETIVVSLSSPSGASLRAPTVHTLTLRDAGQVGILATATDGATTVAKRGTSDAFTVRLTSAPSANVVLGVTASDATEISVTPTSLTFTSADWSAPRTVTVTGTGPDREEGNRVTSVLLRVDDPASAPEYRVVPDEAVEVTVTMASIVSVAGAPVQGDGSEDAAAWGAWSAAPGARDVAAVNYLKLTNAGDKRAARVVIDFTEENFTGELDANYSIAIDGNVRFAWWEDVSPATSAPSEGAFADLAPSPDGTVTLTFSDRGAIVYVRYRIAELPGILPPQPYSAAYTITEI